MPLTKSQLETQESRQEILNEANGRDPREFPWGYFGRDPFVLSGVGVFVWFPTREDLLEALVEAEPAIHFEVDTPEFEQARTTLDALRMSLLDEPGLTEAARQKANEILQGEALIEWWGRLDDLMTGDGDFPREIRTWFREACCDLDDEAGDETDGGEADGMKVSESEDAHAPDRSIEESEKDAFVEALAEYGV